MDCHPRRAPVSHRAGTNSRQAALAVTAVGLFVGFAVAMLAGHCSVRAAEIAASARATPQKSFKTYCIDCHDDATATAGLSLESLAPDYDNSAWIRIHDRIKSGEMPPADSPQPTPKEREAAVAGLAKNLNAAAAARQKAEGRVVLRRMNRREYEHTLHDLLGIAEPLAALLPDGSVT